MCDRSVVEAFAEDALAVAVHTLTPDGKCFLGMRLDGAIMIVAFDT